MSKEGVNVSHYDTIRAALDCIHGADSDKYHAGLAALAKLERASKEPVARVYWSNQTDCLSVTYDDYMKLPPPGSLLYAAPPAPAAEWREPTPDECEKISDVYTATRHSGIAEERGRAMFNAVRAVMEGKS